MHIVVLGAGYAGLRAALDLARLRDAGGRVTVTLVDQEPYHQIVTLLHQVAGAGASEVTRPLATIVADSGIVLRQGRVAAIDTAEQQVRLADGTALAYERLVIALGSLTSYGGVQGAEEHTLTLRTARDAERLHAHILACYERAGGIEEPKERRRQLTVVIVGGGYTGVQLAGELGAWLPKLARERGLDPAEVRIGLIDRSPTLFPGLGTWAATEASRVLDTLGVALYLSTGVERVEPGALILAGARRMRAATIVWAGGIAAPPLLQESGLPTGRGGRLLVDGFLRALRTEQQVVYGLGDCVLARDQAGRDVPANASYALRQGAYLARQIAAELRGERLPAYEPLRLGEVVSLGPGQAVGNPLGIPTTGLAADLLKRGIEAWYLSTLEPNSIGVLF